MSEEEPPANVNRRQFALNAVSSYANLILGVILGLLVTRVLLRHLGPGAFGLWVVLVNMVAYLGLLDAGVSTAAVQRVARLSALGDNEGLANLLRTASAFFAVSGFLAVAIVVVVAPFVSSIVHLGDVSGTVAGPTLIILGVAMATRFLASVPAAVLFGSGRSDRQAQIGLATMVVTQVAQVVVVLAGGGLVGLGAATLAGVVFGYVVSFVVVRSMGDGAFRGGHFDRAVLGDLLRFGSRNMVVAVGGTISYSLDTVIIGIILPVAQVAPYDVALSTANLTRNLTTQGTDLLMPTYAHLAATEDPTRQARLFNRSVLGGLTIAAPIIIALAAFGQDILTLWLGNVPPKTYPIMIALGLVIMLQLPGHQCFVYLTGIGRNQILVRLALVSAAINFAGSIAFTYWLGPIGPAIGSLPAVVVFDFIVLPAVVARYLGMPIGRYVRDALLPVVPVAAAGGVVAIGLLELFPASSGASVLHAGIRAVVCASASVGAAWGVALFMLGRLEPDIQASLIARLRRGRSAG